jgi:hypothetical protein
MPETVALAKQLHAEGLSYGRISAVLVERGHVTGSGPFEAQAPPNGPVSSLPIRPTSLLYLRSETRDLFQSSLPRKAICFPAAQLNVKKIHV